MLTDTEIVITMPYNTQHQRKQESCMMIHNAIQEILGTKCNMTGECSWLPSTKKKKSRLYIQKSLSKDKEFILLLASTGDLPKWGPAGGDATVYTRTKM